MYQEGMDMSKKVVANNGTEYELRFKDFYFWHRDGAVADFLKGGFTSPADALDLMRRYNQTFVQEVNTEVGELETLEKKADLLGYAQNNGIEVPEKYKSVGAIKKFLLGGYDG